MCFNRTHVYAPPLENDGFRKETILPALSLSKSAFAFDIWQWETCAFLPFALGCGMRVLSLCQVLEPWAMNGSQSWTLVVTVTPEGRKKTYECSPCWWILRATALHAPDKGGEEAGYRDLCRSAKHGQPCRALVFTSPGSWKWEASWDMRYGGDPCPLPTSQNDGSTWNVVGSVCVCSQIRMLKPRWWNATGPLLMMVAVKMTGTGSKAGQEDTGKALGACPSQMDVRL